MPWDASSVHGPQNRAPVNSVSTRCVNARSRLVNTLNVSSVSGSSASSTSVAKSASTPSGWSVNVLLVRRTCAVSSVNTRTVCGGSRSSARTYGVVNSRYWLSVRGLRSRPTTRVSARFRVCLLRLR